MRLRNAFVFAFAMAAPVAACAPAITVGADFAPNQGFDAYRSFQWEDADPLPTGDPRLDANPFFAQRVQAAVEEQLLARGLNRSTTPDIVVHFHAAVRDRVEVIEPDQTIRSEPPIRESEVRYWEEGTLLVDVVDAKSKAVVWRGWARTDITGLAANPQREEARIREAVNRMFELFPIAR